MRVSHCLSCAALPRESEEYLWAMDGTTLELTHNHGSEDDAAFSIWSGNEAR